MKLGCLYASGLIETPKIFYCPSNKVEGNKYESYIQPSPWGTLPQDYNTRSGSNSWIRTGYSYYPQSTEKGVDRLPLVASKYGQVDRNKSVVTDIIWTFDKISHVAGDRPKGLNALFGDGHVNFSNNKEAFDPELWLNGLEVRPDSIEFRTILNLLEP